MSGATPPKDGKPSAPTEAGGVKPLIDAVEGRSGLKPTKPYSFDPSKTLPDGSVPLPGMAKDHPDKPKPKTDPTDAPVPPPLIAKSFLATPGTPLATRLFTMSRTKQMYGTIGTRPMFISHAKRTAVRGDTISAFLPTYRRLGQEYSVLNSLNLTPDQRQAAIDFLRKHHKAFNGGLLRELEGIKSGLTQALYQALLPQYSVGESGIIDNIVSLDDTSLASRLNMLGLGTRLQAQMEHVLYNSSFFENVLPLEIKGKDFNLDYKDPSSNIKTTLIKGHVDNAQHTVTFTVDPYTPPELRDLAIKHFIMMVATHAQQNSSNEFKISFGDNPYESLRTLQLAIGTYNMHVPKNLITAYIETLDADTKSKLGDEFNFWAAHSEVFLPRIAENGSKIVDRNKRPDDPDRKGGKMSMAKIQKMLLDRVKEEDLFTIPDPTRSPHASAPTRR